MNRRGFSFIELLVTLTIIGILANLAIPTIRGMRVRAEAASVVADVNAIRAGAFDYYATARVFPRSRAWGQVPPELVGSLPGGFTFNDGRKMYRWQRYGSRRARRTGRVAAVSVRSSDRELIERVKTIYSGGSIAGNRRTVVLYIE